ncbi:MAG: HU family DNA-binding protein, partial [Muribaculaceae bacterium]|nr:HU family DNA-binding protein [Muribaculaceae bacterium]
MNEKLTLPVLVRLMSEMSGRSRRQCEEFIRELFSVLSDTLGAGEDVKVRGIGTFRIIDVEERKSVSVATGQEFIIAGHKKVAFTPDAGLADAVNQSFAMFSPVEVADSVDDDVLSVDTTQDFDEELDLDYDAETEDCCVIEETQISAESASRENDSGNAGFSSTSLDSVEYVLEEDDTPAIIEN